MVDIHDVSHLKALDRTKTMFINNAAHELRTPIASIKLYAYLMQQHPEKWEQYLAPLAQEADDQALLVEDIMLLSRIYAGRLKIERRPTSLDELTGMVIAGHQALAQERGLALEYRPETGFFGKNPVSLVDPEQIMQVLNNLVEDAICFTPAGGKVMTSTGTEEEAEHVWATVAVSDTGEGIPEEDLPHIFERFLREEEPRAQRVARSGMRLMIVKEIVELHGGYLTVESEEGVGSTFTVWLPLAD